jgi:HEAT repeat protein
LDDYGLPVISQQDDYWKRSGVANALFACVDVTTEKSDVLQLFKFLIDEEALADPNAIVQQKMLAAGLACIHSSSGKSNIIELISLFDSYLERPAKPTDDLIRESVVILLGTSACHLPASDSRIPQIIKKLLETLTTPSERVQIAVSQCLAPLIKVNNSPVWINLVMQSLFNTEKYGDRRGFAYGLAGVVKGSGFSCLKKYSIIEQLKSAIEDKKNVNKREAALFALETLSYTLGRLFEPYVTQILPYILGCFGDANGAIRDATHDASRVIMSNISAHCVKLVLPLLLAGLQDRQWRTKTGSIECMKSMSALAPIQLGQSLPTIIPKICEALSDTHQKVQDCAQNALSSFGSVIKNPEIQELVPILIAALTDPNNKTLRALGSLLQTTFVHYIDAPSLAFLVPIIYRGMTERSAETKKKASLLLGNMASLTDERDLLPYMDNLIPSLKEVLVDPVPQTRETAARAFGFMVQKLGEKKFPGLVDELFENLALNISSVDKYGAAQGLSEILHGIGSERLESLLPQIIVRVKSSKAYEREGFTILLNYLPLTFEAKFTPYIADITPAILDGLADEEDAVREAALKTGKVIVNNYAKSAVDLLLPQLETGLFNGNWRIRQNSMQLMGELLFKISGISTSVADDDEPDTDEGGVGTEAQRKALKDALGLERYYAVLASIYIIRNDISAMVRKASLHVWKSIVTNTPKTLKDILPYMMDLLIRSLASESADKRDIASRTLEDLVQKLEENLLLEIIPTLETGLRSGDETTKHGACIAMSEIMASSARSGQEKFIFNCAPLIKLALLDSDSEVRLSAAHAFDVLHQTTGARAIDDILPPMLAELKKDASGNALEGLKEIMAVRSNVVFPVLIPTLLASPINSFNAQALGSLVSVAGNALNKRLYTILPALMKDMEAHETPDVENTLSILLSSAQGADGVHAVMNILEEAVNEPTLSYQLIALHCLTLFFKNSAGDIVDYVDGWITRLISLLSNDRGEERVKKSWEALDVLVKRTDKEDLPDYITAVRRGIKQAGGADHISEIAGFNLTKGMSPLLTILLTGLMYGNMSSREEAALGLGEVISRTSESALKPFVTQMTGPLIRVVGDRFSVSVKIAILKTIGYLTPYLGCYLSRFHQ